MKKTLVTAEDLKDLLWNGEGYSLLSIPPEHLPVVLGDEHVESLQNIFDNSVLIVSYERLIDMINGFDELVLLHVALSTITRWINEERS